MFPGSKTAPSVGNCGFTPIVKYNSEQIVIQCISDKKLDTCRNIFAVYITKLKISLSFYLDWSLSKASKMYVCCAPII